MMTAHKIVIASTNSGKIKEISKMLNQALGMQVEIQSLQDLDYLNVDEPEEPHHSFMENAVHKAKYYGKLTQETTLSEDSGLCIEALEGFPGVRTKEFVLECGGIENAFKTLENKLQGFENRRAYFNCASVFYMPKQDILISHEDRDYGSICFPPRGEDGFAFDPIFVPEGYDKTFAELGVEAKNKMSHRGKAIRGLIEKLQKMWEVGS